MFFFPFSFIYVGVSLRLYSAHPCVFLGGCERGICWPCNDADLNRVVLTSHRVGEWRDDEVEEDVAKFLRTQLAPPVDFGPSSGDLRTSQTLEAVAEWTGIMGYSRDHVPWIGPIPESLGGGEGLFLCAGYSGHGMPNTSLSAHAVVEMMRGVYPGGGVMDYKLPEEYVITEERISRARKEIEVQGWGELGCVVDYPELLEMRRAKAQNLDGSP